MKVVMTGGGTGGHVTPVKYVAHSLKELKPDSQVYFIGKTGDRFVSIIEQDKNFNSIDLIRAGKWRRYKRAWWKSLIDIPTHILNFRDVFYLLIGSFQAYKILGRIKPDIVFAKGGFVSVPVVFAASRRKIPVVTHDSDAIPGLANRLSSRWAKVNAVGQRVNYPYPKEKVKYTGMPISPEFSKKASEEIIKKYKPGFFNGNKTIFSIGGSLGAKTINDAIFATVENLINHNINIIHLVGKNDMPRAKKIKEFANYLPLEFVTDPVELNAYYQMSDIIISRAGATTTAEIAALGKPAIIIPASQLADQNKNAELLNNSKAAIVLSDREITNEPQVLVDEIIELSNDTELASEFTENFAKLISTNGSKEIAKILIDQAKK